MVGGYQNLSRYDVDGTSFFETDLAFKQAVDRARKGKGPSVIISHVVRLLPHSSSDDQRKYRSDKDLESDKKKDPIDQFEKYCVNKKVASAKDFETLRSKIFEQVNKDAEWADKQNHPDISTALNHVYSDQKSLKETSLKTINEKVVLVDAINHALKEEMEHNEKMVIYGQDIADPKGGVFTATKGLSDRFGKQRVFNSPLAESSIIGTAVGMACAGYKPVVEIQFGDYIWTCLLYTSDAADE